jgi:hypothetical protein
MEINFLDIAQTFYHPTFNDLSLKTERFKKIWEETAEERKELSNFVLDVLDHANPQNKLYKEGTQKPEELKTAWEEKTAKRRLTFLSEIGEIFSPASPEEAEDFNQIDSRLEMMRVMADISCAALEEIKNKIYA